ncbi:PAS domain-containing protein, partial [Nodularia spumigena]|uniref:PAS domain-containing protein n=1 Tax=Nodularia spumigena TaxID=70799 RepID=UPI002B1FBC55
MTGPPCPPADPVDDRADGPSREPTLAGATAPVGADLALFNALDEGVVAVDAAMTIVFANPAAERMFGYRADDMLGTPLDRLIPVDSRGRHRQQVERFRDGQASSRMMGARSAVRGLRADGTVFEAEASISRRTLAGTVLLMAIIRDVTARREAEARLRASEQKHRAILETCSDAVLIADADSGLILEVNA